MLVGSCGWSLWGDIQPGLAQLTCLRCTTRRCSPRLPLYLSNITSVTSKDWTACSLPLKSKSSSTSVEQPRKGEQKPRGLCSLAFTGTVFRLLVSAFLSTTKSHAWRSFAFTNCVASPGSQLTPCVMSGVHREGNLLCHISTNLGCSESSQALQALTHDN